MRRVIDLFGWRLIVSLKPHMGGPQFKVYRMGPDWYLNVLWLSFALGRRVDVVDA